MTSTRTLLLVVVATLLAVALTPRDAHGIGGRLGLNVVRMEPNGPAEDLGKASWGGGLEGVFVLPSTANLFATVVGFEGVNFNTAESSYKPGPFAFERTLSSSQDLVRIYLGLQFGPHGHGLLQPFVGLNGSLAWHTVSTTLAERYDNPDLDRSQTDSASDFGTGYDVTAGLHLNVLNRFGAYGGVRYLHLFGIDQPIGDEGRTIDPEYVQGFLGLSMDFGYMEKLSKN